MMETILLLATIAQRYTLTSIPTCRVVPEPSITLRFKHGLETSLQAGDELSIIPAVAGG